MGLPTPLPPSFPTSPGRVLRAQVDIPQKHDFGISPASQTQLREHHGPRVKGPCESRQASGSSEQFPRRMQSGRQEGGVRGGSGHMSMPYVGGGRCPTPLWDRMQGLDPASRRVVEQPHKAWKGSHCNLTDSTTIAVPAHKPGSGGWAWEAGGWYPHVLRTGLSSPRQIRMAQHQQTTGQAGEQQSRLE